MAAIGRTYGTFPRCKWSDYRRAQMFYFSLGHWNQNLQVALQLGVTKQASRQALCRTGASAEKSLYNPEPSEIVERYKFHTRFLINDQALQRVTSFKYLTISVRM